MGAPFRQTSKRGWREHYVTIFLRRAVGDTSWSRLDGEERRLRGSAAPAVRPPASVDVLDQPSASRDKSLTAR